MDHLRIIKRAFNITFAYRALWVFGILLALTTSRGGGNGGGGSGSGPQFQGDQETWRNLPFFRDWNWQGGNIPSIPQDVINGLIAGGIALLCVFLIIGVVLAVLRYVSTVSAIRMTNDYEASGEKISVRQGFRLGWSRSAFRLWLIDLLIGIIGFVTVILLLAVAAAPLLLWLTQNETAGIIGTVIAIGMAILAILIMVVGFSLVGIWLEIVRRAVVLEGLGVMDGIRRGWQIARRRLGDLIIMGLILFGIGIAFTILMIPVGILVFMVAGLSGVLPGLLAWAITNLFVQDRISIIVGIIVGLPIFLAVLSIPLLFVSGLYEVFTSSTWTLTFRELLALNTVRTEPEPNPVLPDPELGAV
jgi:hypothetical protein